MRSTTNLHWPSEPFGATQRPFAPDRPMMAAVAVGWAGYVRRPEWACVIYLYVDSTRTLELDGQALNFGFEVLTGEPEDRHQAALAERLDDILVACRRHAKVLAGHDLADDLTSLLSFGVGRRLPGIDAVRQQWSNRQVKERGMTAVIDTAFDIDGLDVADLAAASDRAGLKAATITQSGSTTVATTVRQAIVRTLAIALIAARAKGHYMWHIPVDLDELAADTAWDQFCQLTDTPLDAGST